LRIVEGKINECGMSLMIVIVVVGGVVYLHLLALEFTLDPLAVWSVTNERKDRADTFD
jgi:hypothetical protein